MKKSQYSYFFDFEDQFVGYSWLSDGYVAFPESEKEIVEKILDNPDEVLTNLDAKIFKKLLQNQVLVPEGVDEYQYILDQHKKAIHDNDFLRLIILPTLSCNLDCPYCYETHEGSKMEKDTVQHIKSYLEKKLNSLKKLTISWFGGEPLLYPEIIRNISHFASKEAEKSGVYYNGTITTNATLLSEENISLLKKVGVSEVHVTLDGSKTTHDQKRIPAEGGKTYENIVTNVKNFLDQGPENKLILRVHIHSKDKREIKGIQKIFEEFERYRSQIKIYFRQLFSSCTEAWDHDFLEETSSLLPENDYEKDEVMLDLYREAIDKDFPIYFGKSLAACYADYDSSWVIKPDGLVHKCTVALEEGRSLGRLTKDGIKYFWDRYTDWQQKTSDNFDREELQNCPYFPLSWGKCPYSKYQNPDQKSSCKEMNNSVRTQEKLLGIKSRYAGRRNKRDEG